MSLPDKVVVLSVIVLSTNAACGMSGDLDWLNDQDIEHFASSFSTEIQSSFWLNDQNIDESFASPFLTEPQPIVAQTIFNYQNSPSYRWICDNGPNDMEVLRYYIEAIGRYCMKNGIDIKFDKNTLSTEQNIYGWLDANWQAVSEIIPQLHPNILLLLPLHIRQKFKSRIPGNVCYLVKESELRNYLASCGVINMPTSHYNNSGMAAWIVQNWEDIEAKMNNQDKAQISDQNKAIYYDYANSPSYELFNAFDIHRYADILRIAQQAMDQYNIAHPNDPNPICLTRDEKKCKSGLLRRLDQELDILTPYISYVIFKYNALNVNKVLNEISQQPQSVPKMLPIPINIAGTKRDTTQNEASQKQDQSSAWSSSYFDDVLIMGRPSESDDSLGNVFQQQRLSTIYRGTHFYDIETMEQLFEDSIMSGTVPPPQKQLDEIWDGPHLQDA